jgi:hypothetical protein
VSTARWVPMKTLYINALIKVPVQSELLINVGHLPMSIRVASRWDTKAARCGSVGKGGRGLVRAVDDKMLVGPVLVQSELLMNVGHLPMSIRVASRWNAKAARWSPASWSSLCQQR